MLYFSNLTSFLGKINPGWDLFIMIFFAIMTVYGILLGKNRTIAIVLSTYVGYVIAHEFGQMVFDWSQKLTLYNNAVGTSSFGAQVITFVVVLLLLVAKNNFGREESKDLSDTAITALYGFLAAGLIMTSIFSFIGEAERSIILDSSTLAAHVYDLRTIWLLGPLAAVLVSNYLIKRIKS